MRRVRILQGVSGLDFSWTPGEVVELEDDVAERWADGERAELLDDDQGDDGEDGTPPPGPDDEQQGFDPIVHTIKEVRAHLEDADEAEAIRVLDLEAAGEGRKGIMNDREAILEQARTRDTQRAGGEQAAAEKAAEASRGGGRGDGTETR